MQATTAARPTAPSHTCRWKKQHRMARPGSAAPARAARPGIGGHASRGVKRSSGATRYIAQPLAQPR
jgi:hypothetical protein